jgi:DNA-binding NarL/FixJ family response regulator
MLLPGKAPVVQVTRGQVLVVEDDDAVARGYARILGRLGFSVASCGSMAAARARLHVANDFTIALVDIRLPDGSGLELVEILCASHGEVAPVVITGELDSAASLKCWTLGVLAINKPFVAEQLEALIPAVVHRHDRWIERVSAFARATGLSRQEEAVVRCAVEGLDVAASAVTLGCAASTADTYWRRVFKKTDFHSKLAVVAAIARGHVGGESSVSGVRERVTDVVDRTSEGRVRRLGR